MNKYKLITSPSSEGFNRLLSDALKQGWSPFGELCANVAIAKSTYDTKVEYLYSLLLIRKSEN